MSPEEIDQVLTQMKEEPCTIERARELRHELGLTQAQLAEELELTHGAISMKERGKARIRRVYIGYLSFRLFLKRAAEADQPEGFEQMEFNFEGDTASE